MPLDRLANRVAADLDALMREAHIPGVGLSVVCDGTVLLAEGYGQADPEACIPATRDTLYPLASLAKGFTATAVMQLVEQGEIVLDAALSTYLSGLPLAWRSVTPRHLLTHTSGIPCYLNDMPDASSWGAWPASRSPRSWGAPTTTRATRWRSWRSRCGWRDCWVRGP